METKSAFMTAGGIGIARTVNELAYGDATAPVQDALDARRGVLLGSSYEYPGRHARHDLAFVDPPLSVEARGPVTTVAALNERGQVILPAIAATLRGLPAVAEIDARDTTAITLHLVPPARDFPEEERSKQPSVFSLLRAIGDLFASPDPYLGLYGAFGYDLALQFEPLRLERARPAELRDLVLYLPDEVVTVDHRREVAHQIRYELSHAGRTTMTLPRTTDRAPVSALGLDSTAPASPPSGSHPANRAPRGDFA